MKISARLVVAFFCGVLIVGPIILLSLFSNATDDAVSSFVPLWDGSISRALLNSVDERNQEIQQVFQLVTAQLSQAADGSGNSLDLSFLGDYSAALTSFMNQVESTTLSPTTEASISRDHFSFAVFSPTTTINDYFSVHTIAFPHTGANPHPQAPFTLMIDDEDFLELSLIFPSNMSAARNEPSLVLASWEKYACSIVVANSLSSLTPRDLFGSMAILSSVHAFMFSPGNGVLASLVSPLSSDDTRILVCDEAFERFHDDLEFVERVAINSSLLGHLVIQRSTQALKTSNSLYPMNLALGSSALASMLFSVPDGDARFDLYAVENSDNTFSVGCAIAVQDTQLAFQLNAAEDCDDRIIGFSTSQLQRMALSSNSFSEDSQLFLSITRLPIRFQRSVTNPTPSECLYLLVSYPSSTTRDVVNSASSRSVIISVSVTAFSFVVTLTTLHYIFHALKVIGTLLRACADIQLQNLEQQSPIFVSEIFFLQLSVDLLVYRMRKIGKYMPDKSQLYQLLRNEDALTTFSSTPIGVHGFVNSRWSGAVVHTVTVIVEYRSRANPTQARTHNEFEKKTVFEFVYSGQENLFSNLESQCRERLGERVGESLQLYDQNMLDNPAGAHGLTCNEDVIEMIQRANNRTLRLVVMKTSSKQYYRWFLIAWSFVDVAVLVLCGVQLVQSTMTNDSQVGLAFLLLLVFRFGMNLLLSMYLIRHFAKLFPPFAQWVPVAMQETMIATLLSCASAANIRIIFSATRLTKALRFNAPYTEAMRPTIVRVTFGCILYGNVAPLCLAVYAIAKRNATHSGVLLMLISSTISIGIFAGENFFERIVVWWKLIRSGQDGFGGGDQDEALHPISALMQEDDQRDDDEFILSNRNGEDRASGGVLTAGQPSSLYLGLAVRETTILRVSFRNASAILSRLPPQEIQKFCSSFFSSVFAQAKIHGAIVLHVFNCDVTLGFNCHQSQSDHKTRALLCFSAISQSVETSQSTSRPSGHPAVSGAIVSSDKCMVGFVGYGETRAFQHLGYSARELDTVFRIGSFYGCSLATTALFSRQIEHGEFVLPGLSLETRIIETVSFDSLIHARDTVVGRRASSSIVSQRRLGLQSRYLLSIHEVLINVGSDARSMIDASQAVLAPLKQELVERQSQFVGSEKLLTSLNLTPKSASSNNQAHAFLSPSALMKSYLSNFSRDLVMRAIEVRIQGSADSRLPRAASIAMGIDLLGMEFNVAEDGTGDDSVVVSDPPPRSQLESLATSKKFTLYFTDL